mgnify:CR=1 FL=1
MKKPLKSLALIFALVLVLGMLAGCGATSALKPSAEDQAPAADNTSEAKNPEEGKKIELTVFAAASLTETLKEIGDLYIKQNPDVDLIFTFDSSGTLKTQIQEGADCDIFISAAQKQMNQLDITASSEINTEGLDFVLEGTRVDLLENKVALCIPEGNPANINSYEDLAAALKKDNFMMAMGNSDVPVGQYTQKILTYFKLDEKDLADTGHLTYGSNVKEVTTQISEGTVDCGIIYATDAFSAGLTVVDTATTEMCGQVIYPAAVLKGTQNKEAAQAFLDFLKTDAAAEIFKSVGFSMID